MPRLIDADALPVVHAYVDDDGMYRDIVYNEDLNAAPTVDAVAVVRCRECVNRNTCDCPLTYAVQWGIGNEEPSDDDFCSYGERKEAADGRTD